MLFFFSPLTTVSLSLSSDGGGRTGAYLAIDSNLEYAKEDNMYDVFNYAKRLRQMRRGLIDSVEQYKFVYECLEEAHKSGKTCFSVSDLAVKMRFKSIRDPLTKMNEYQREFEKILKVTPKFSIGDCAGGHRVENRSKNRDVLTIPRMYLFLDLVTEVRKKESVLLLY